MRKNKGLDTLIKAALEVVSDKHEWSTKWLYSRFDHETRGADSCSITCLKCGSILSVMLGPPEGEPHVLVFDGRMVKDIERWTLKGKELVKDD